MAPMDISETVKRIRIENGWTQKELAEKLKKNQAVVSRYESGEYMPPGDILMQILEYEKVD